jgi:acyl carrier protein
MSLEKFIKDFEEAVEDLEPGSIEGSTVFQKLAVWDSLALLTVIAMVDFEYGASIKASLLKECETIEALYQAIKGSES